MHHQQGGIARTSPQIGDSLAAELPIVNILKHVYKFFIELQKQGTTTEKFCFQQKHKRN